MPRCLRVILAALVVCAAAVIAAGCASSRNAHLPGGSPETLAGKLNLPPTIASGRDLKPAESAGTAAAGDPAAPAPADDANAPPPSDTASSATENPDAEDEDGAKTIVIHKYRFGLEQAAQWALANNLSLMNMRDQVTGSQFNVRAAAADFEVKIIPRANAGLTGGTGGTHAASGAGLELSKKMSTGTVADVSGTTASNGTSTTSGVGATLTQPLLRGLGKTVNEDALLDARFGVLSSRRSFVQFEEALVVSVVRGFYEIIKQRELVDLSRKSAERMRRHMDAAQAREKVGLASRIDVLRADIQMRQAQDSLLAAEQAYGDAVDSLRVMLGFGPQDDVEIDSDLTYNEFTVDQDQAILMAMTNRLDLAQSRDEIEVAERKVRVAKNNTLPQLDLVLGYAQSGTGSSFSDSTGLRDSTWTLGLATSTDIRRTAERARYEQSKLDFEARKRNNQLLQDTLVREVKDAIRRLDVSRKRIDIQKAEMDQAQQKLRLAKIKFDRGLGDNFDLITAEEEVLRAQSAHIAAVTDYIVSQVEVKRALGTLIEKPAGLK